MKPKQYEALMKVVQPGDFIYTGYDNFLSRAIAALQKKKVKGWPSELSHVGFITHKMGGEMKIAESAIMRKGLKLVSGVLVRPIKSWTKDNIFPKKSRPAAKWIVVQRFKGMTEEKAKRMTEVALRLREQKMFYPIRELIGTAILIEKYSFLKKIGAHKLAQKVIDRKNPLDNKKARYCIALASHCKLKIPSKPLVKVESSCTVGEGITYGGGEIIFVERP